VFWRQVQAPRGINEQQNTASADLGFSLVHPAVNSNGWPARVYGIRPGSNAGLKVMDPEELCTTGVICTGQDGFGERISGFHYGQAVTHVELQQDATTGLIISGCQASIDCGDGFSSSSPRRLFNNSADIYQCTSSRGQQCYVVAVAAGFFGGIQNLSLLPTLCRMQTYQYHPQLALFDVTRTGSTPSDPQLLKVATTQVGESTGDAGHAFTVVVATRGTGSTAHQYAFVGDIDVGRVLVYDVSYDQLFPASSVPYPTSDLQFPIAVLPLPRDPYDGAPTNVIALKIPTTQPNYLYCALSRTGVGVVNITDPTNPQLCTILDTPGLALGLSFRMLAGNHEQMIVGDSRCGIRVYE
jgi:hypothetical protein